MTDSICYIVGAGSMAGVALRPRPEDYVIAADGGFSHVEALGLRADLVLGDFDSLGRVPDHPNLRRHPAVKDDTDMLLAARTGDEMGFGTFVLLGGMGGRLDHTLANLQTLVWLSRRGRRAFLVGEGTAAAAVTNGTLRFAAREKGVISVFCAGEAAAGVWLTGLKYPLENAVLTCDMPLGVSNEFIGGESAVTVGEGTLLALWPYTPEQSFGELI